MRHQFGDAASSIPQLSINDILFSGVKYCKVMAVERILFTYPILLLPLQPINCAWLS